MRVVQGECMLLAATSEFPQQEPEHAPFQSDRTVFITDRRYGDTRPGCRARATTRATKWAADKLMSVRPRRRLLATARVLRNYSILFSAIKLPAIRPNAGRMLAGDGESRVTDGYRTVRRNAVSTVSRAIEQKLSCWLCKQRTPANAHRRQCQGSHLESRSDIIARFDSVVKYSDSLFYIDFF